MFKLNKRNGEKSMKHFTTNFSLNDSLNSNKKPTENAESEVLTKAIQNKIKLIEKAFC